MTTRTNGSSRSAGSITSIPREDSDVYSYALRVAVLSANVAQARAPPPSSSAGASSTASTSTLKPTPPPLRHSSSFRPADGWTKSLFSLGDVFKDASGKDGAGVKFPKEFVKVLDAKMERIAKGADPAYSDPLLRQTIAAFYTKYATPAFQRKIKENRQTEELILMFGATASPVLKGQLPGDEWKTALDVHVGKFIYIVRDALKSKEVRNVPPELLSRLEAHCAKLSTPAPNNDPYSSPAVPSTSKFTLDVAPPPIPGMTTNVQEMPLVRAVGKLFGKTNAELTKDVIAIRRLCSEKAAFTDLKALINNVARGARFPARRDDFDSDDAFQAWKKQEGDELQEMLFEMMKRSPELLQSGPTEVAHRSVDMNGNNSNRSSVIGLASPSANGSSTGLSASGGEEEIVDSSFVFVPPDPKFYYKRLFEIALDHDYDAMSELPPDEDVSLTILSDVHEELLRDCAIRWRVIEPVRASTFLALIAQHYKHHGVPEACVGEALNMLERAEANWNYWRWPWADRQYLFKNLQAIFNILLPRFFEIFEGILDLPFEEVVELMERINGNEVFSEDVRDLKTTLDELRLGMKKFIQFAYEEKQADVDSLDRPHDLWPFLTMLVWITSETKGYNKRFPQPVLAALDVPAIFIGVAAPEFVKHLDASRSALLAAASQSPDAGAAHDEDLLDLYRGVIELQKMHNAFCVETPLEIDFSSWFEPYVRRWLVTTDAKTMEWVSRAIQQDKFEPDGADKHSSSIVDLIDSCRSATDFIIKLEWPNQLENARYLTALSQTIAKAIEQYSYQLESMFLAEMFPPKAGEVGNMDVNRPSAWLTKAKLAVQGDRKVEPFVFQPKTLVKLNNIQAARKLLDTMYNTLDADKVASIIEINAPPVPEKAEPPRFLFTVKIVLGENLVGPDGNPRNKIDPFLILSDPHGHRVAKTRTLYETNDPRWDETFDVSVQGDLWIRATVYNRNLVDHHDLLACAYIHLNPREFGDFLARDVWLRLEDNAQKPLNSRLLLRISMEGERDDIRFYFGRAFRSLKRAENDMTRNIVDKMSPFVRHYISTTTLHALTRTGFNFEFDIDLERMRGGFTKATGKMNAYVQQALNTDAAHIIPPVASELDSPTLPSKAEMARKKGRGPLTDKEIEDAIGDLFDYFNQTFGTLAENLSEEAWDLVSTRLWKEILATIEALIVPPLSDQPTEMRPLSEKEIDIVFKWLGFLVNFFHAEGEGLPLTALRNTKYQELVQARMYYDWSPDALCEEAVRAMSRQLLTKKNSVISRSKSVYQQRNLDSIKARKIEKQQTHVESGEIILRILRMHPGNQEFLTQQISTMLRVQSELQKAKQDTGYGHARAGSLQRRVGDGRGGGGAGGRGSRLSTTRGRGRGNAAPAVPPLPTIQDR